MPEESNEQPRDRRAMFRLGLQKLVGPFAGFIEERFPLPLPTPRTVLRPPGALPERAFLDTCYRSGNCIDVCPAKAVRPLSSGDAEQAGTPYVDPDLAACAVCEDLSCMRACPSGALKLVTEPGAIRMGLARVNPHLCLRSRGEDCRRCLEQCPFGAAAIGLDERNQVAVKTAGCVGCGRCQFSCPAVPKAICVDPVP